MLTSTHADNKCLFIKDNADTNSPVETNFDADGIEDAGNADTKPPVEPSADAEGNEDAANTDTDPISNGTAEETRNAVAISDETESHSKGNDSVQGIDDSADEGYSPANDKESDDEDDVGTYEEQRGRVKLQGDIEEPNQLLRSSGGNPQL
ncbi:hypothetical protein GN958_ATG11134 [Phytophthora infestans]|uniref:Uncharacterized protein n=1 Tax=Phytophthora infestans TaxID=4787 RepID=A0A8S9UKP1_PHYIN|nr:hypothetical protein GN958_ATG11134 [Phytophthora infestans]